MREIKFKAFHKPSKKMFDVYCFTDDEVMERSFDGVLTSETLPALRKDCELLQYTGLKDCDEKDIYEGDIVEVKDKPYKSIEPTVVTWGKKSHGWSLKFFYECSFGVEKVTSYKYYSLSASKYMKKLGNIYENEIFSVKEILSNE